MDSARFIVHLFERNIIWIIANYLLVSHFLAKWWVEPNLLFSLSVITTKQLQKNWTQSFLKRRPYTIVIFHKILFRSPMISAFFLFHKNIFSISIHFIIWERRNGINSKQSNPHIMSNIIKSIHLLSDHIIVYLKRSNLKINLAA